MFQFDDYLLALGGKVGALFKTTSGHENVGKNVREEDPQ